MRRASGPRPAPRGLAPARRAGRGAAALVLAATLLSACGGVRRVAGADAEPAERAGDGERREAPDRPSDRGVPPEGERPRIPAAPEALLSAGTVGELQAALADRGLLGKHTRGELDDATSRALRTFQEQEGLAATGFPDRETLARLGLQPDAAYGRGD